MIRQHQFTKVELVSITTPEQSRRARADDRLRRGGAEAARLPYRVVVLSTGDMGFGAQDLRHRGLAAGAGALPRDLVVLELRRLPGAADERAPKKGEKGTRFVHTLNGSGLAVGRTLIAVLENYQRADGSVEVPAVLRPYMGGLEVIERDAVRVG